MFKHIKTQPNIKSRYNLYFEGGREMKKVKFFYCTNGNFCYMPSNRKRNGYLVPNSWFETILVMEEVKPRVYSVVDNAKSLLRKLHPNVWENLRKELEAIVEGKDYEKSFYFLDNPNGLKFRNVTSILNDSQKLELKQAFEDKTRVSYTNSYNYNRKKDLSITTNPKGCFRAWFSSEYIGCGNGSYYLLINPTTAVYCEDD